MTRTDSADSIRVVLADDHTLFRAGVREMLLTLEGLDVVSEASNGDEAVQHAVRHTPDVLLLDVQMPGVNASTVIRNVRHRSPDTRIIVLTMFPDPLVVRELLDCGASAFLSKTSLRIELLAAVRAVAANSDTVVLAVPRSSMSTFESRTDVPKQSTLTDREIDVLTLAAEALGNRQIATRLTISEATVKRHLTNIFAKLDAVSRVDAIRKAITAKVIEPPAGPSAD